MPPLRSLRGSAAICARGITAAVAAVLLGLTLAPSADALAAPPLGLRASDRASSSWAVSWTPVKGVAHYRIKYSTSSSMRNPAFRRLSEARGEVTGLKPSTTYYVQIKSITAKGKSLSRYSKATRITTRAKGEYSHLYPHGLRAAPPLSTSLALTWSHRGSGIRYRLAWSRSASMSAAQLITVTPTAARITGLKPATSYWFKVRVIDPVGKARSAYSPTVKVTTAKASEAIPDPLRVGSYNVRCHSCYTGSREEKPWTDRRDAVVALIKGSDLDVLGVQEANSSRVKNPDGTLSGLSQFEDLVARLGAPWKLVNGKRNNCVRHTTTSGCVYRDQGASKGTKILYNADRVKVLASGSKLLAEMEGRSQRYVAWAVLRQRSTGAEFIFADTHLENLDDAAGVYTALRRRQTAGVLDAVKAHNSAGRPAIIVGDFNSDKWTTPSNAPYDLLRSEGYVDPLGNSYRSKTTAPGATVEHRVNTSLNTLNSFRRTAAGHPRWVNGTQIDYILTTPMRVLEWETVADLDAYGRFRGVVPSDHNLVRATLVLPKPA